MRKDRLFAGLTLTAVLLFGAGCGGPAITAGTVTDKRYDAMKVITKQSCTTSGNTKVCTPVITVDPEGWELLLRADGRSDWHEVTRDEFERYQIGQVYP